MAEVVVVGMSTLDQQRTSGDKHSEGHGLWMMWLQWFGLVSKKRELNYSSVKVNQCSCHVVYQQVPLIPIRASEFPHAPGLSYFLDGSCDERWKVRVLTNLGLQKPASTLGALWTNATTFGNQKALELKSPWQLRSGTNIIPSLQISDLTKRDLHFKAPSSPSVGR